MAKALNRPRLVFSEREDSTEKTKYSTREAERVELNWIRAEKTQTFKTVFLGDSNVGKTCLARLFVDREVLELSSNTIGFDHHVREIEVEEGVRVKFQVWDTAGMEQFRNALVTKYYRNADGIILVYDITQQESFEHIEFWLDEVKRYIGLEKVRLVLIGNKLDQSALRKVTVEDGQALADRHGMSFYEISARDAKQIPKLHEIFAMLARELVKVREKMELTLTQSGIIHLGTTVNESDEWVLVNAPDSPIPRSTYAAQEMKARLQSLVPRRFRRSRERTVRRQNRTSSRSIGNSHNTCTCS